MNHFYRNHISQIKTTGKSTDLKNLQNGSLTYNEAIPNQYQNERAYVTDNNYDNRPTEKIENADVKFTPSLDLLLKEKEVNLKSRPPSVSKSLAHSKENSYLICNNSKISNNTSIKSYLERRHQESQQKINLMRIQKLKHETENMQFKPKISENSKKIINQIIKREISREPKKIIETHQHSNNTLIRSSSNSNLTDKYVDKTYENVPLHRSAEACQLYQESPYYEVYFYNEFFSQIKTMIFRYIEIM